MLKFNRTSRGHERGMLALAVVGPGVSGALSRAPSRSRARGLLASCSCPKRVGARSSRSPTLLAAVLAQDPPDACSAASRTRLEGATWSMAKAVAACWASPRPASWSSPRSWCTRSRRHRDARPLGDVPRPDHHPDHRQRRRARDGGGRGAERARSTWRCRSRSGRAPRWPCWWRRLLVLAGLLIGQPHESGLHDLRGRGAGPGHLVTAIITLDGESHWFEGVQLLALYAMVAVAAFFL